MCVLSTYFYLINYYDTKVKKKLEFILVLILFKILFKSHIDKSDLITIYIVINILFK